MKFHIIAATAALMTVSGMAFAQTTSAPVTSPTNPIQAEMNDMDREFFESGTDFTPLFSDMETMTMLEGDEFTEAFSGMGEEDRASIIAACERAEQDRGSFGAVTTGLCDQVGAYEK